jgi:hypothetical protein
MGALKPWHVFVCIAVTLVIIGLAAAIISAGRRR